MLNNSVRGKTFNPISINCSAAPGEMSIKSRAMKPSLYVMKDIADQQFGPSQMFALILCKLKLVWEVRRRFDERGHGPQEQKKHKD